MSETLLVISLQVLQSLNEDEKFDQFVENIDSKNTNQQITGVVEIVSGNYRFFASHRDTPNSRLAVIRPNEIFWNLTTRQKSALLERVRKVVTRSSSRPFQLPQSWRFYKESNKAMFFGLPPNIARSNPRWVVQYEPADTVVFWDLYSSDGPYVDISRIEIESTIAERTRGYWISDVLDKVSEYFKSTSRAVDQGVITLRPPSGSAYSHPQTFEDWMSPGALTPDQSNFVLSESDSIRLKGPAGTGKTLALVLKSIHESIKILSRNGGEYPRVLFATHNWATAEQVLDTIHALDPVGVVDFFTVAPLLQVIEEIRPLQAGISLLGADGEEDRQLQLLILRDAVDRFLKDEYLRFRDKCSESVRKGLEYQDSDGTQLARFLSDLLNEFAVVMGGEGIQDRPVDETRYIEIDRQKRWLDLNEADRKCVYRVYKNFLYALKSENRLTSDQFMLVSSQWFNSFEWGPLRQSRGYDMIFVDELHLFSSIERGILNHLSRDSGRYPRLYMSLDPNQSPTGRYGSYTTDRAFEDGQDVVELREVHRYTPEILELVQHINRTVPAEDFATVWSVDIQGTTSRRDSGPRPEIRDCKFGVDRTSVVAVAESQRMLSTNSSVALIVLDGDRLNEFLNVVEHGEISARFAVIRSRDDLGASIRVRRRIVIGTPETLAGLQFDAIVVSGFPESSIYSQIDSRRIEFLSRLYLAVTRASSQIKFILHSDDDGLPDVLSGATQRGLVQRVK